MQASTKPKRMAKVLKLTKMLQKPGLDAMKRVALQNRLDKLLDKLADKVQSRVLGISVPSCYVGSW